MAAFFLSNVGQNSRAKLEKNAGVEIAAGGASAAVPGHGAAAEQKSLWVKKMGQSLERNFLLTSACSKLQVVFCSTEFTPLATTRRLHIVHDG